jgi:hypothetical protein
VPDTLLQYSLHKPRRGRSEIRHSCPGSA